MSTKILLVDDEQDILDIHGLMLKGAGYEVDTSLSGTEALKKLAEHEYNIVISDINMPQTTGLDLLRWVNMNKPQIRMALITGFSHLSETLTAAELGCNAFLAKPIKQEDLLATIKAMLNSEQLVVFDEKKYAPLAIDTFISGKQVAFPLFVRMGDGRFLKIASTGDDLDLERMKSFQEKGVNQLWLEREDFLKYSAMSQQIAKMALGKTEIDENKRMTIIKHACEVAYEQLRLVGISNQTLDAARETFTVALSAFDKNPSVGAIINTIASGTSHLYSHAAVCGFLSALLTKVMDWSSQKNINSLVLGGFIHDIGLYSLPAELQILNTLKLTDAQKEKYKKHTQLGAELLKKIPGFTEDVLLIVRQHHENPNGTGYPMGLLRSDIFPMAKIVALIDEFSIQLLKLAPQFRNQGEKLLDTMVNRDRTLYDPIAVLALSHALKYPSIQQAKEQYSHAMSSPRQH